MFDDLGSVNVPILDYAATGTVVDPISERLRRYQTTVVAFLRSSTRIDPCDQTTSICCFVVGERDQLTPRSIKYELGEHAARQPCDVHILKGDVRIAVDQRAGQLVGKVPPLIGRLFGVTRKILLRLEPALTSPLAPGKSTLKATLFLRCLGNPLRGSDEFTFRRGDQAGQADINSDNCCAMDRPLNIRRFDREANVPFAARPGNYGRSNLGVIWKPPMPLDLDFARNPDDAKLSAFADHKAVAYPEVSAIVPAFRSETRKSSLAFFQTSEECLEGFVDTPQNLLFRCISVSSQLLITKTNVLQLVGLIKIAKRFASPLIRFDTLLKAGVIQVTETSKHIRQAISLHFAWI